MILLYAFSKQRTWCYWCYRVTATDRYYMIAWIIFTHRLDIPGTCFPSTGVRRIAIPRTQLPIISISRPGSGFLVRKRPYVSKCVRFTGRGTERDGREKKLKCKPRHTCLNLEHYPVFTQSSRHAHSWVCLNLSKTEQRLPVCCFC